MNYPNTPIAEQRRIVLFGLRNSGKSSLMNNLFERDVSIISDHPGTTTDPVTKSFELIPVGPVAVTDTAGLDDTGDLGALRVRKSRELLAIADLAVLVTRGDTPPSEPEKTFFTETAKKKKTVIVMTFGASQPDPQKKAWAGQYDHIVLDNVRKTGIDDFRKFLVKSLKTLSTERTPVEGLVKDNDLALLVTPIDPGAPKGRLILPEAETIRDLLDRNCAALVVKESELKHFYHSLKVRPKLVITDSQAFSRVAADIPADQPLTSFSILFARKKGDLAYYLQGVRSLNDLPEKPRIMVLESCAHHRQEDDIGTVKIPRLFRQHVHSGAEFEFLKELPNDDKLDRFDLVIGCGGCMVTRNLIMDRVDRMRSRNIPVTNYGLFLAWVNGLLPRAIEMFPSEYDAYRA